MPASYPLTSWAHRPCYVKRHFKISLKRFFYAHLTPDASILCESTFIVDGWYRWLFFPGKIFVLKYIAIIKTSSAQNPGAVGNESLCFCTAQEVCSKLQNQAKCDSAYFKTIPLKIYRFLHFLIAQIAIIARTIYHRSKAIVPNLIKKALHYRVLL